jgi:nickel-type superoxide dismutase maturation protease
VTTLLVELLATLRGRRRFLRVRGRSMLPTLMPGEVLGIEPARDLRPEPGAIVLLRDPERPGRRTIKRVQSCGDTSLFVVGDNEEESRDSRHFGSVPIDRLIGRLAWVWSSDRGFRRFDGVGGRD